MFGLDKNKKITIKFISCIVANAISFFISVLVHILIEASIQPQILIVTANVMVNCEVKNCVKYIRQYSAVFTKKPLKKIEKPAGASTCTLVNQ